MPKEEIYLEPSEKNFEEIRRQIQLDVAREAKEIIEQAKKEADEIIKKTNREIEKRKQEASIELDRQTAIIKQKILSGINLEKKKISLGEKNKLIEEIFSQIKLEAEVFRRSAEYSDFLKKTVAEAVKIIDSASLDVLYSPLDEKIVSAEFQKETVDFYRSKTGEDISLSFVKGDFKDIGFIIQSKDGKVIFENTFLARLRRAYDDIYMELLRKL